jgi:hypothetical protein
MEAAFRVERYRPPTTVLTLIAGTMLLLGIMVISRRARKRLETKQEVTETRGMAAGGEPEVAARIECPKLIPTEARGHEPGGDERAPTVACRPDAATEQETELGAQQQTGSRRTDLAQAPQPRSLNWFEVSQEHWRRNLQGLNKLTRSQSVQEFTAIRSELVREGLQQMAEDSRMMVETSMRVVDEAGKAFSGYATDSRSNVR